ncbi:2'-5'-oligoadenylate synthase-like protein isoform X2 [Marmota monax]|uniref:2'-5'-oligoadenylate synthase-like protein isoform X2 n=1 Tax=Marmota monax TaxID=9995 RepID=UPI0026EF9432|nr:2'-5'-oligoadenylate synthase-like protein isoform X2 [Marmota monax]
MALAQELYGVPASRLDSFVAQWLQPSRGWKEEVLEAVHTVEQFLRQEAFQGERALDPEARVLKVVKVGSFGNGTVLRSEADVELVVFLSCFHSFQEEAKYHQTVLRLIWGKLWCCQDLLDLGLSDLRITQGVPSALDFTIQTRGTAEPINITIVPAYRALGPAVPNSQPPPEVYVNLIKACGYPGNFSPSFSELQRCFVKHRPTKVKSLLRLVKHWYQQYVRAKCPRANLPPVYALELLTIYAWETGTQENENFKLDEGLSTVMELLQDYEFICIYWTKYYTLQHPTIQDFVREQFKKESAEIHPRASCKPGKCSVLYHRVPPPVPSAPPPYPALFFNPVSGGPPLVPGPNPRGNQTNPWSQALCGRSRAPPRDEPLCLRCPKSHGGACTAPLGLQTGPPQGAGQQRPVLVVASREPRVYRPPSSLLSGSVTPVGLPEQKILE